MLDQRHGPLPIYFLALTVLTGLVDAASYLGLGHVFVANMTGNVVFLGFAAAQVSGFSIAASIIAIAAFMIGALCGGAIGRAFGGHRGYVLWVALGLETLLAAIAVALILGQAAFPSVQASFASRLTTPAIIAVLALAMGLQNSIVRRLAVPDLTTTVLTLTITGIAADHATAAGSLIRRWASILCMFLGAGIGGACILLLDLKAVLIAGFVLLVVVFIAAFRTRHSAEAWTKPQ